MFTIKEYFVNKNKDKEKTRFYQPNKSWKFINNSDKNQTVGESFKFFNWTLSFTKNVVQVAFIIFVVANLFIMGMIIWHNAQTGELFAMDIYIDKVFEMFIAVIGGYIIKSAVENSIRITFSVVNDYLEKKLQIQIEQAAGETLEVDDCTNSDDAGEDMSGLDPNEQ